jgi:hypothetical protein
MCCDAGARQTPAYDQLEQETPAVSRRGSSDDARWHREERDHAAAENGADGGAVFHVTLPTFIDLPTGRIIPLH